MMRARTSGVPSESRDHRELLAPVYLRGVFLGDTFAREVGDRFGGGSQHLSRCGGGATNAAAEQLRYESTKT